MPRRYRRTEFTIATAPRSSVPDPRGSGEPAGDGALLGHLTSPDSDGPVPVVLLAHGYKSPLEWGWFPELSDRLAQAGMASIAFVHSLSGLTRTSDRVEDEAAFGRNTYTRELEDFERVRAWATEHDELCDASRVGLYGYSRGGGMGLLHAAERADYLALALWAPMDRVMKFSAESIERWRAEGRIRVTEYGTDRKLWLGPELLADAERNANRLDIPSAAARLRTPVLLVGAERDAAAPPEALERLAGAFAPEHLERHTFPGVGHGFGLDRPRRDGTGTLQRALELTVAHFARYLVGAD